MKISTALFSILIRDSWFTVAFTSAIYVQRRGGKKCLFNVILLIKMPFFLRCPMATGERTSLNKLTAYSSKELLATNWMSALKVDQRNNLGFMRLNCNQVVDL